MKMVTLYDNIRRIEGAKVNIKNSIEQKGVHINEPTPLEDYYLKIDEIDSSTVPGGYFDFANAGYTEQEIKEANRILKEIITVQGADLINVFDVSEPDKRCYFDPGTYDSIADKTPLYFPSLNWSSTVNIAGIFQNNHSLVYFPKTTFSKCTNASRAFLNCINLSGTLDIDFPELAETINSPASSHCFDGCSALKKVILRCPLFETINFTFCTDTDSNIEEINIIDSYSLKQLSIWNDGERYKKLRKITANNLDKCTSTSFQNIPLLEDIVIPETPALEAIAFINCPSLKKVTFPYTQKVENLHNAFKDTLNIEYVGEITLNADYSKQNVIDIFSGDSTYPDKMYDKLTYLGGFKNLRSDLDLSKCPKLTKQSILNVFNKAGEVSYLVITLHPSVKKLLNPQDIEIATKKGWMVN